MKKLTTETEIRLDNIEKRLEHHETTQWIHFIIIMVYLIIMMLGIGVTHYFIMHAIVYH